MLKFLVLLATIGTYPGNPQPEIWSRQATTSTVPRLIPGYPPRQLFYRQNQGQTVQVWGWADTEGEIHWFPSENPHIPAAATMVGAVKNYGVNLQQSHSALNRVGTEMKTNDPAFASAFHGISSLPHAAHPGKPCPGPGPCPNPDPSPPRPLPFDPRAPVVDRDVILLGVAGVIGVGLVLFARKRKGLS